MIEISKLGNQGYEIDKPLEEFSENQKKAYELINNAFEFYDRNKLSTDNIFKLIREKVVNQKYEVKELLRFLVANENTDLERKGRFIYKEEISNE